jgi:hypothetical protein
MLKMKALCVHGSQRGDKQSLITSVFTTESSNTKHAKGSLLSRPEIEKSKFGRPSQDKTSTYTLPRSPVPASIQNCDGLVVSASMSHFVIHVVEDLRSGSGQGLMRYSFCWSLPERAVMSENKKPIRSGYGLLTFSRPLFHHGGTMFSLGKKCFTGMDTSEMTSLVFEQ